MIIKDLISPWRKPLRRYYIKSLFPGCLTLLFFTFGINFPQVIAEPWQKLLWVFLVLLPFLWTCKIYLSYLIECDEVERRIELDAIAVGSLCALTSSLSLILAMSTRLISPPAELAIGAVVLPLCIGFGLARSYWLWRFLK